MIVELPLAWLIFVNIIAWPIIHVVLAWIGLKLPRHWFAPDQWLYRERSWERRGRFYERFCAVRRWKDRLPDGAAMLNTGFQKSTLSARDPKYLAIFLKETCRGEAVHWAVFACAALFFIWNTWYVGLIMVAYATCANLPCIISQRYNRIRLTRLIQFTTKS